MTTDSHPMVLAERLQLGPVVAVLAAMLLFWFVGPLAGAEPARRSPNILWLVAENVGPDLGCYGAGQVVTPNLDRLAAQGMRYTRAFATAPVCSPSRSAFMTGMYQTAIGAHNHRSHRIPGVDDHFHLPIDVRPVMHRTIDAGYYTANVTTMDGRVFLGPGAEPPRPYVFGARDRTDEAVQRIRTVRSGRYRYIRNFMPDKPFLASHLYKEATYPVYAALRQCQAGGTLTPAQATLTTSRLPDEELYDMQNDPHEVRNLAASTDPEHQRILKELRVELDRWLVATDDQGRFPESPEIIAYWKAEAQGRHGEHPK